MGSRRWWWLSLAVLVASACTQAGSSDPATTSVPPEKVPVQTGPSITTVAPEPSGIPGLDADDPFCSAWAGYVGTLQVLGVAAAFGELTSADLAALELAGAPRLVEVAAAIDASWPPELASEHATVIDQRIGPYLRRASLAVDALRTAGVTDPELTTLRSAWQAALSSRDPEDPVMDLPPFTPDLRAKLDTAAVAYDNDVTVFAQDPSLAVDGVDAPATDAYLVTHCPDLASSGVGDAL